MKALNNILRNTVPAIALAAALGFGLTSCNNADAANPDASPLSEISKNEIEDTSLAAALEEAFAELEAEEAPDSAATIEESIEILRAEACTAIEAYEPVDASSTFDKEVGKVYIYSKVKMQKGENSTINHTYFLDGKEIQTVNLKVKGPTFRTRSYKTIHKGMDGEWKVEITNTGGKLLDTVTFTVE